jgi:hypothetical protein
MFPAHADAGAPRGGIPMTKASSFRKAGLTWLRIMAGIKQSVSLRKKAAPRNFIALLPFSFPKQSR